MGCYEQTPQSHNRDELGVASFLISLNSWEMQGFLHLQTNLTLSLLTKHAVRVVFIVKAYFILPPIFELQDIRKLREKLGSMGSVVARRAAADELAQNQYVLRVKAPTTPHFF